MDDSDLTWQLEHGSVECNESFVASLRERQDYLPVIKSVDEPLVDSRNHFDIKRQEGSDRVQNGFREVVVDRESRHDYAAFA